MAIESWCDSLHIYGRTLIHTWLNRSKNKVVRKKKFSRADASSIFKLENKVRRYDFFIYYYLLHLILTSSVPPLLVGPNRLGVCLENMAESACTTDICIF